jgi:hypothetical protein
MVWNELETERHGAPGRRGDGAGTAVILKRVGSSPEKNLWARDKTTRQSAINVF